MTKLKNQLLLDQNGDKMTEESTICPKCNYQPWLKNPMHESVYTLHCECHEISDPDLFKLADQWREYIKSFEKQNEEL